MFWPPYAAKGGTIGTAPAHWLVEVYNEPSEWVYPPRSVTVLVPIIRLGRCRGGGEDVEAGKHEMLVLPGGFNVFTDFKGTSPRAPQVTVRVPTVGRRK